MNEPGNSPPPVILSLATNFDMAEFQSEAAIPEETRPVIDTRPPSLAVSASPVLDPGVASLSIADLLESDVHLEWPEAVAIAHRLCRAMAQDPAAGLHECLLEPRNVEITERGEIRVLPGPPGGDPIVKQVGRILGALLQEAVAPAPLRLVASQAAFDVPVYGTIDDLADELRRFDTPEQSSAVRTVFQRGVQARHSHHVEHRASVPRPALAPALNVIPAGAEKAVRSPAPQFARESTPRSLVPAGAAAVVVLAGGIFLMQPWNAAPPERLSRPSVPVAPAPAPITTPTTAVEPDETGVPVAPPVLEPAALKPAVTEAPAVPRASIARREPPKGPGTEARSAGSTALAVAEPMPGPQPPLGGEPPEMAARRAARLLASGRADEAQHIFDFITMTQPLADPAGMSLGPDAARAFRASRRVLLPVLAEREAQLARGALEAGDFDRAVSVGTRALAMLNDPDVGTPPSPLLATIGRVVARASAAKAAEEDRIYTLADLGVTPPAALSRQLPIAMPPGVSRQMLGTIEMVIDREGQVEAVRLHTPLNRYHERMIVSAAKAWRYKPALRNGKPVRFSLLVSITLPESSD